jgi:uncharacterized protein YdaU (DUF1376 family)
MTRPPAFLFYARDFLADEHVAAMTLEQVGAYIVLLCYAWQAADGLEDNLEALAKLVHLDRAEFSRRIWPALAPCFVRDGARLKQKRLEHARAQAKAHSDAGRTAALARWTRRR